MKMQLTICSAAAISPQNTFKSDAWTHTLNASVDNKLWNVEPDYRGFIHPVAVRRMGRVIKSGIAAGLEALQLAGVEKPDAIIGGTGRGSMSNTQSFLNDMISLEEEALNPNHFIQSTYNSATGWLALSTKSKGYNQMYVQRGHSFEWCILDAHLVSEEANGKAVTLAGSLDELTDEFYNIRNQLGYWKKHEINNAQLFTQQESIGSISGEGSAFFCLKNREEAGCPVITNMQLGYEVSLVAWEKMWSALLQESQLAPGDIDLVLTGRNGDLPSGQFYDEVLELLNTKNEVCFKHLCGEYDTATSFGCFIAQYLLREQQLPATLHFNGKKPAMPINNLLFINHFGTESLTMLLLQKG